MVFCGNIRYVTQNGSADPGQHPDRRRRSWPLGGRLAPRQPPGSSAAPRSPAPPRLAASTWPLRGESVSVSHKRTYKVQQHGTRPLDRRPALPLPDAERSSDSSLPTASQSSTQGLYPTGITVFFLVVTDTELTSSGSVWKTLKD